MGGIKLSWIRRDFLIGGASALAYMRGVRINAAPRFPDNPFTLGGASGEPTQDGFVLWTSLAPSPFDEMSGMPLEPVVVEWLVSSDEGMRKVVA